jgi:hypothetical protein
MSHAPKENAGSDWDPYTDKSYADDDEESGIGRE